MKTPSIIGSTSGAFSLLLEVEVIGKERNQRKFDGIQSSLAMMLARIKSWVMQWGLKAKELKATFYIDLGKGREVVLREGLLPKDQQSKSSFHSCDGGN